MKLMKALVVMALVLFMAAPAFAEFKLNGYYRLQGTFYDTDSGANSKNKDFSQRLRMMMTNQLNENVSFVYYGEVDSDWGQDRAGFLEDDPDSEGDNDFGADQIDLETKNVYLALKGDNWSSKLGVQGIGDTFDGLIFADDMAGATANFKLGAANLGLVYSKFEEGEKNINDDSDLYGGTVSFAASDMATVGASVYYASIENIEDSGYDSSLLYYGLNASVALSEALSLNAFALAMDASHDNPGWADGDTYILNADANYKFDNGNVKFRVLYAPDESNEEDEFIQLSETALNGEGLMFLGGDVNATNNGAGEDKYKTPLTEGDGLTAIMLSGTFNLSNGVYVKGAFAWADTDTEELGTEIGVMVGKKFFGNVDVSVRAAKWNDGDYKGDNGDATKVIGMVNVGF